MAITPKRLADNLERVRDNMASAARRSGRRAESVTLVAVTKTAELEDVKNLVELGVVELGESRVQHLLQRAEELKAWQDRRRRETPPVRWHMLGHLQRNKVKAVLAVSGVIHSVDSLRLAEDISERAGPLGARADVLLQVNCSEEPQKSGVAVGAASALAEQMTTLPNLRLLGLMTMAPLVKDPHAARPTFVRLRELFEEMRHDNIGGKDFVHLSMGMSQDYAVAIEEGATIIRVGTALLG